MTQIITTTHRAVFVQGHFRKSPDKPRSNDMLHSMLRLEVELEKALEEAMEERAVRGGE